MSGDVTEGYRATHWGELMTGYPGGYAVMVGEDGRHVAIVKTPNGVILTCERHALVENDDGTITLFPAIRVNERASRAWFGTLVDGVWTEA